MGAHVPEFQSEDTNTLVRQNYVRIMFISGHNKDWITNTGNRNSDRAQQASLRLWQSMNYEIPQRMCSIHVGLRRTYLRPPLLRLVLCHCIEIQISESSSFNKKRHMQLNMRSEWVGEYSGWPQKSKPLSLIIIKSYLNPPLWLDFSSISTRKWAQEYNKSVWNILCVT